MKKSNLRVFKMLTNVSAVALFCLFGSSAFADSYSYSCRLELPLQDGNSYEYEIRTLANYDLDRLKLTEVKNSTISVYLLQNGVRKETYVLNQELETASIGDYFAVLDYKQAAFSLNARLSFVEGPQAATAKVYHVYQEGSRVSTTAVAMCSVEN